MYCRVLLLCLPLSWTSFSSTSHFLLTWLTLLLVSLWTDGFQLWCPLRVWEAVCSVSASHMPGEGTPFDHCLRNLGFSVETGSQKASHPPQGHSPSSHCSWGQSAPIPVLQNALQSVVPWSSQEFILAWPYLMILGAFLASSSCGLFG